MQLNVMSGAVHVHTATARVTVARVRRVILAPLEGAAHLGDPLHCHLLADPVRDVQLAFDHLEYLQYGCV